MKQIQLMLSFVVFLIVLGSPTICRAQQATLTDDAYFPQPKNSYTVKVLSIDASTSTRAFVKFRLDTTLPPGTPGANVAKATLRLFVSNIVVAGSFSVHRVANPWNESDTTPPPYDTLSIASANVSSPSSFVTVDVTSIVQEWLGTNGGGAGGVLNFGLALVAEGATAISFDSKETTLTGHLPQLEVILNHALTADSATDLNGQLDGSQVTGVLTNVTIPAANITGTVANALNATALIGSINGSQVTGALPNATIAGTAVTGSVANATNATNADSVNNGVYTTGSYSNPPWITSLAATKITGTVSSSASANTVVDGSITSSKISTNQVVKSLNSLRDDVNIVAGANFSIVPSGNTLIMSASTGLNNVSHDDTLNGNGTQGTPLSVKTPVIETPTGNIFVGRGAGSRNTFGGSLTFLGNFAGAQNTTGNENSFFGTNAGQANSTGDHNSFFGSTAGNSNTTGVSNNFYGAAAGFSNQTGHRNAFFGVDAGRSNIAGESNSFFGTAAGYNNQASNNAFFGFGAGFNNTQGSNNTFVGSGSGSGNEDGSQNTFIGYQSRGTASITNATAVGATAFVSQSDSVVLGNNANVGIGVSAPKAKLHVVGGGLLIGSPGQGIILTAPNGTTCRLLTIDNAGSIVLTAVSCP